MYYDEIDQEMDRLYREKEERKAFQREELQHRIAKAGARYQKANNDLLKAEIDDAPNATLNKLYADKQAKWQEFQALMNEMDALNNG